MCLGPAVEPATEKAKTYVTIIRVLLVVQAVVVILNFVAANAFLREAIFGIFFFFILYIIQHQVSYQVIMVYIFISIFFAITFIQSDNLKPVTISFLAFQGRFDTNWGLTSAAGIIVILPVVILFLALQRRFISGLTAGSVKE